MISLVNELISTVPNPRGHVADCAARALRFAAAGPTDENARLGLAVLTELALEAPDACPEHVRHLQASIHLALGH